jgi:GNAT superfamily N-acetyltransferase
VHIREATPDDIAFLTEMWHAAAFWQPERFTMTVDDALATPEIARYIADWGRDGDLALLAEDDGKQLGAAWYRRFTREEPGYGFVDENTPEIAIAVVGEARGRGLGTVLLEALIARARAEGLPGLSLSVNEDNPSRRIYERAGFTDVSRDDNSYVMLLRFV